MKILGAAITFVLMSSSLFSAEPDSRWKAVEEAMQKGLPRSAITNLEPIIASATAAGDYPQAVKALGTKIVLEATIEGGRPEEKIPRLEQVLEEAAAPMRPVLETLLAHWYWDYFQQNRWRFMDRTLTATAPGEDFTTWDLGRLFAEIDQHFQAALKAADTIQATAITNWDGLLVKGTMPDAYRPTLYDFVAYQALEFYTSGEQAATKPQGTFELRAEDPIFGTADEFMKWEPTASKGGLDPARQAVVLFQQLMRFHEKDGAPRLAFAHADLERLRWAANTAFGEEKNERYKAALRRFIREHENHEISAVAAERLARVLQEENDLVAAREVARKAAEAFPESPGGKLCRNLVTQIEAKSAGIVTERVWNEPWPDITVTYRNVETAYFRAVPFEWSTFLDRRRNRPENLNDRERREILSRKAALEWTVKLPPTTDYKERKHRTPAPSTLKPGYYFIVASHDPSFGEAENMVSFTDVWVSELALITRSRDGRIEGFVLEANSGEPLAGANVSAWHLNNQGTRVAVPQMNTDTNGFFSFTPPTPSGHLIRASHNGREVATPFEISAHERDPVRPTGQTILFTDRAIYRPGQMVHYKGIALWVDTARNNYEVLKGQELTVVLLDVNGKEIARTVHRANDFGSFSGTFTAPRDRLMGHMTLQVQGRAPGAAGVRVEEYKRPKFQVTLQPPKAAPKLNEEVTLEGQAISYAGAPIDNANVSFRVVRHTIMPPWWGWWRGGWPRGGGAQEIAHGTLTTDLDGKFALEFTAAADLSVPEKDEPSFNFEVHVDVTDNAGETRSADRGVRIGYAAYQVAVEAEDWQTSGQLVPLTVKVRSLDGEARVAKGTLKVHSLKAPDAVVRGRLAQHRPFYYRGGGIQPAEEPEDPDMSDPRNWPLAEVILERTFTTATNGEAKIELSLPVGAFQALVEVQDPGGKKVTGKLPLQVVDPADTSLEIKAPHLVAAPSWSVQPGETFSALWGTGYESGRAFVEIQHRGSFLRRLWTAPGRTQQQIQLAITEAMRGGFVLHVTQVRENRAYFTTRVVQVPWTNKELKLRWDHFVSKLEPGKEESWTLEVRGPTQGSTAERQTAEVVASLYDESLDAFLPHSWMDRFSFFHQEQVRIHSLFANTIADFRRVLGNWSTKFESVTITYRDFPPEFEQRSNRFLRRYGLAARSGVLADESLALAAAPMAAGVMPAAAARPESQMEESFGTAKAGAADAVTSAAPAPPAGPSAPALEEVSARRNLNESAFFFPQLTTDSNGVVRLKFTMPEALTKWRFLGFAHDRQLRSGFLEAHAVTSKELMVQPNPPRFLREGDTIEFSVKIQNQSKQAQSGTARLTFSQAQTDESADELLGTTKPVQAFEVPAGESRSLSWRITVPDGMGFLTYKVVAATDSLSDGEEGAIPVLSRRVLVTESMTLPIRGPGTKEFTLEKLAQSSGSDTLRHQSLSLQMVSNPAWYAVLALPYLMEFPHECSEQVFNRLYANALARKIANSDPKIRRVFDQWKNTPALDSPLEKNEDLKAVALEETPWFRQAQKESAARRNVGILFDANRLDNEQQRTLQKLMEMQLPDGLWPWFPGGRGNDYITLYITTGFGRLRHLGVEVDQGPAVRSLQRLDEWMRERYEEIQKGNKPEDYVPGATDALYLYGRSFYLPDAPIAEAHKKTVDFFLGQARKFWVKTGNRQTQGHLALALKRFDAGQNSTDTTPADILKSLRERSVSNEELGMFWRDTEISWWWYRAPIETQALMIEAFDEVANDTEAVEACRVWLLKQKQTQNWKTTKATADAVYSLLLRGTDILTSKELVRVKLGGEDVTPVAGRPPESTREDPAEKPAVEPGTGFYEVRFLRSEVKPAMAEVTISKRDEGVAWGSLNWQYFEDLSKVTPHEGTPLKLQKALFRKKNTSAGPVLEEVKGPLSVGDELVVRIELRVDRDMEYIHMKDQRGSGTEPVNVLSRYKYQDGLAYYESTRDTASHFFIDYLPKGTYVFEYSTRIQLRGEYPSGVTQIQCMYAPEFNSHSGSVPIVVRD